MTVRVVFMLMALYAPACMLEDTDFLQILQGVLYSSEAIDEGLIHVFPVDPETGEIDYSQTLGSAYSDADGRFTVEISKYYPLLALVASGGETGEFWADRRIQLRASGHTFAIVAYGLPLERGDSGHIQSVAMTPLTTLVKALADARYNQRKDGTFSDSLEKSHDLLYKHFIGEAPLRYTCASQLTCLQPTTMTSWDEARKHAFWIAGFSAQANEVANREGYTLKEMNTIDVVDAMKLDVEDDAVFNGTGDMDFGQNAMRGELSNAIAKWLLNTPWARHMNIDGTTRMLSKIAENMEYELFGDTPVTPFDHNP